MSGDRLSKPDTQIHADPEQFTRRAMQSIQWTMYRSWMTALVFLVDWGGGTEHGIIGLKGAS